MARTIGFFAALALPLGSGLVAAGQARDDGLEPACLEVPTLEFGYKPAGAPSEESPQATTCETLER